MAEIQLGVLPLEMEDKWFLFFEEPHLHCHRSWTGLEAFELKFTTDEGGAKVSEIRVSQDPDGVNFPNVEEGAKEALRLISVCLLGVRPEVDAENPLSEWHNYGRQILGQGPRPGKDDARSD